MKSGNYLVTVEHMVTLAGGFGSGPPADPDSISWRGAGRRVAAWPAALVSLSCLSFPSANPGQVCMPVDSKGNTYVGHTQQ